jgi:hypothetical protein
MVMNVENNQTIKGFSLNPLTLSLLIDVVLVISIAQLSVIGYHQQKSNYFYPINGESTVSVLMSDITDAKIDFYIQSTNNAQTLQYPIRINYSVINSNHEGFARCSGLGILLIQKCSVRLPKSYVQNHSPVLFSFSTGAPKNTYGIWGTDSMVENEQTLFINNEEHMGALEIVTYKSAFNEFDFNSLSKSFALLMSTTLIHYIFGRAIRKRLFPNSRFKFQEEFVITISLGIASEVGVLAVFSVLGIPFRYFLTTIIFVFLILLIIEIIDKYRANKGFRLEKCRSFTNVGFVSLLISIHLLGALQIQQINAPMWFDGLFHYNLLDGMLSSNSIFPRTIYPNLYHIISLINQKLFSISIPQSLLITGQWIISLSSFSFLLLGNILEFNASKKWISFFIFLFLSPFPSYLINWSRFPFALGFLLVPLCIYCVYNLFNNRDYKWFFIIISGLVALSHYSAFIFMVSGVIAVVLYKRKEIVFSTTKINNRKKIILLIALLLPGMAYLIIRLIGVLSSGTFTTIVEQTRLQAESTDYLYVFGLLVQKGGGVILILGVIGLFRNFYKSKNNINILISWTIFIIILAILQKLIIGALISSIVNILYFLFIPLCYFAGSIITEFYEKLDEKLTAPKYLLILNKYNFWGGKYKFGLLTALVILFLVVNPKMMTITPRAIIVTDDDLLAYDWIDKSTADNSVFIVNFGEWGQKFTPIDGGAWIKAYTNRNIQTPDFFLDQESFWQFIGDQGVDYAYFGSKEGIIKQNWIEKCPIVYQNDSVIIFDVGPQKCTFGNTITTYHKNKINFDETIFYLRSSRIES